MGHKRLFLLICIFSLAGYAPFLNSDAIAKEIAQGDGDPIEVSAQERLLAAQKLADDEEDDQTPTLTAEGDFLVPTYLLPDTKEEDKLEISPAIKVQPKSVQPTVNVSKKVINVKKKVQTDLPIVKIKQTELIPVNEQLAVEESLTGSTSKTRGIYNEAINRSSNRTHLISSKQSSIGLTNDNEIDNILAGAEQETKLQNMQQGMPEGKKKPLLLPLKGTKKPVKKITEDEIVSHPRLRTYSSAYADKVLEASQTGEELPLIMPMDLKVSFYPNAADFSGQTIKWLKAFSYKALQDPRYVVEVRLSKENIALQQKRLFVIQKILANAGLSNHQFVVDYVNRPKDSLILRMVKKEPDVNIRSRTKKDKGVINW